MKLCLLITVLLGWLLVPTHCASEQKRIDKLEFSVVTRELDLTSNLAKEKTRIVLENKGDKPVSSFLYTIPRGVSDKLAYIGGQVGYCNFY